jgi:dihydrofolate synthase/folylpolyglutamate synthase
MTEQESYEGALNWLYELQYFGMKLGLSNTRSLLSELGDPQEKFKSVHVAGTNGKGSVCAFLTSVLMNAGLRVGTYTSPHLFDFGERICVNGYPMGRARVLRSVRQIRPKIEAMAGEDRQCTFFEAATCMAFREFARRKVDIAVVEVGMGGRLDSTNVITPEVSVITNISREHTQHLGETLGEIAGEKAGIIKKGVPTVSAVPEPESKAVIESKAREMKSKLYNVQGNVECRVLEQDLLGSVLHVRTPSADYQPIRIRLPGAHQAANASTAILASEILAERGMPVSGENIARGMAEARWPARLQVVRRKPTVILDSTHNPGGAQTLADFLRAHLSNNPPLMVLAMLEDKEVEPVVKLLELLVSEALITQSTYHRRMKAEDLAGRFSASVRIHPILADAVNSALALAGENGTVLITGSIYTASEALSHLDAARAREMIAILSEAHGIGAYPGRNPETPGPPPPGSQDPFRVLISTMLSQRTKDENTHIASEALFSRYRSPSELAAAKPEDIEPLIRPAGFYRQKARNIILTSKAIVEIHSSKVPADLDALASLPGVGRKTANCVLAYGFGLPAIAVDTHVHRICNLLGLVNTEGPEGTEEMLAIKIPKEHWHDINRLLVRHGQTICSPTRPKCRICPISHLCDHGINNR